MNYKVVIDPRQGGEKTGVTGNGIIEKDYNLLISNYIKERLDQLGISNIITRNTDRYLTDDERAQIISTAFGNDSNVIVLSNGLTNEDEGVQIIYALKDNDKLASTIFNSVESANLPADRYYQLRSDVNTALDSYLVIRYNNKYKPVVILYGNVNNSTDATSLKNNYQKYGEAVVKAIADYTGAKYTPVGDNYYVVVKGDSLYKIATKYNISVDDLKKANNLTSNLLNIGQVLYIPKKSSSDESSNKNIYTVQKGDTLYGIALKNKVTVDDIKRANNLTSNTLSIGQKLIIPTSNSIYIVKKGDTLYSIARNNNTTVDKIKKDNNLTSNTLSIGQKLIIN